MKLRCLPSMMAMGVSSYKPLYVIIIINHKKCSILKFHKDWLLNVSLTNSTLGFSITRVCVLQGEEVALYCSKYLPDIIKEQKTYKDGKLQKVTCLFQFFVDAPV